MSVVEATDLRFKLDQEVAFVAVAYPVSVTGRAASPMRRPARRATPVSAL